MKRKVTNIKELRALPEGSTLCRKSGIFWFELPGRFKDVPTERVDQKFIYSLVNSGVILRHKSTVISSSSYLLYSLDKDQLSPAGVDSTIWRVGLVLRVLEDKSIRTLTSFYEALETHGFYYSTSRPAYVPVSYWGGDARVNRIRFTGFRFDYTYYDYRVLRWMREDFTKLRSYLRGEAPE